MGVYVELGLGLAFIIGTLWFTILFMLRVTKKTEEGKKLLDAAGEVWLEFWK
jgi:hypothetical protein